MPSCRLSRPALAVVLVTFLAAAGPGRAEAQPAGPEQKAEPPAPAWKISGLVFGDFYLFAQDHDERFDGQSGFWLRRGYLTYDHTLAPTLATRFRLEVNSDGKMAGGSLTPFVKDAYLRWSYRKGHQAFVGLQPTPTLETIDGVWGLRYVERVAADLYRFDTTRDLGVGVTGSLNAGGTVRYAAQIGNDSGTASETDGKMAIRLAARYDTNPGLFVEGSYWHADRAGGADREALQVFAAYRHARGRAAVNLVRHERDAAPGSLPAVETSVVSGFGVLEVRPGRLSVFARLDRVFDPLPDGGIDYLPISTASPFTFGLFGVEYRPAPSVWLAPNLEFVRYGTPRDGAAARPRNDVVVRASFHWAW